jgi:copper chaperone CopZ
MDKKTVQIPNIGCNGCVNTIVSEIGELPGVQAVTGDVDTKKVTIEWNSPTTWDGIVEKLAEIDYAPPSV